MGISLSATVSKALPPDYFFNDCVTVRIIGIGRKLHHLIKTRSSAVGKANRAMQIRNGKAVTPLKTSPPLDLLTCRIRSFKVGNYSHT